MKNDNINNIILNEMKKINITIIHFNIYNLKDLILLKIIYNNV